MKNVSAEDSIRAIVRGVVEVYAETFSLRHISELEDPQGTLNMKIHNVFIACLGEEIQYYSALARSLDSSLGNLLEKMAVNIAALFYEVYKTVEGSLSVEQTNFIAGLLNDYKNYEKKPRVNDYQWLRNKPAARDLKIREHNSDYYLIDRATETHYLIELKIGGDLDNKKARSEKEALLEQFAILSNTLPADARIKCFFATAYNRFGEGKEWKQSRVRQFFAREELLIGADFWNFVCKSDKGYAIVNDELLKNFHYIVNAHAIYN